MAAPTSDAEQAAFLAQLRVLQQAMEAEQASRSAHTAPADSAPREAAAACVHGSNPARAGAALEPDPQAACSVGPGAGPAVTASAGACVLRRGLAGINTAVSAGRVAVSSAVTRGVPAAASAARHVGKALEGHKEAAMDTALRLALERGLRNAGARLIVLLSEDEDMPACARARVRGGSEWLWSEVETEVMAAVLLENTFAARRARALELEQLEAEARELPCCSHPLSRLRAQVLYTLYPYDRSAWGQLRMPAFYPLLLLQLCPLYGVQPLFFLLLFCLRDKSDEFQLCQFILEFKGLQFVTLGALAGLMAGAQAQWCATHGTCDRMGLQGAPGMHETFWFEVCAFVLNVLLVWAAFVLLPLSMQKGALGAYARDAEAAGGRAPHLASAPGGTAAPEAADPRAAPGLRGALGRALRGRGASAPDKSSAAEAEAAQRCCCGCLAFHPRRGGALRSLLVYDLAVFVACVSLAGLAGATSSGWRLRSWLSWCRVLYGLGSLPFVFFAVPPFDRVLLHAKPTAYDRQGRCVAPLSLRDRQLRNDVLRAAALRAAEDKGAGGVAPRPGAASDAAAGACSASRPGAGALASRAAAPSERCSGGGGAPKQRVAHHDRGHLL